MCDKQSIPLASSNIALQATQNENVTPIKWSCVIEWVRTKNETPSVQAALSITVEHYRLKKVSLYDQSITV